MQVKKFEAPTMIEALQLVNMELGSEAIILSTKNHKNGYGLLSKASVEVTAAVADYSLERKRQSEKQGTEALARPQPISSNSVQSLQEELQRLKVMLEELRTEQTALTDARIPETSNEELHYAFQDLLHNGIEKKLATALIKNVATSLPHEDRQKTDRIKESLSMEMKHHLKIEDVLLHSSGQHQVIALIGPTGVGKTTTIAKLASQAILQKNQSVALINVDAYKVAASDQLSTYAKILNIPFRQTSTVLELDRVLTEFKLLDLILIDTSGCSQRDTESLTKIKNLFSEFPMIKPILVMSATTRDQELYDIINRFKIFDPKAAIFSKLDETLTFGSIYNVSAKTGLPLTHFTVGQRVPEDIEAATRERVASMILDL